MRSSVALTAREQALLTPSSAHIDTRAVVKAERGGQNLCVAAHPVDCTSIETVR